MPVDFHWVRKKRAKRSEMTKFLDVCGNFLGQNLKSRVLLALRDTACFLSLKRFFATEFDSGYS